MEALILKEAVSASDYTNKHSNSMRILLYETKTERIALSLEVEYIGKYIGLRKIRTPDENYVVFTLAIE
jgi:LytS/YehU family sensor histidine kinase